MTDTVCRVAVHSAGTQATVDLVLPTECPVGALLPSIVDCVLGDAAAAPGRLFLAHVGGPALDQAETLRQNGVRDGDLLLLTAAQVPRPRLVPVAPTGLVVTADGGSAGPGPDGVSATALAVLVALAAALLWAGRVNAVESALWVAAALSAATALASATGRLPRPLPVTMAAGAAVFAGVTGVLAAAGASAAATVLQASCATLAMSVVLLRFVFGAVTVLTGFAALAGAVAAASVVAVVAAPSAACAGALLTVVSLAALSSAPKLTVAAAGLGPSRSVVGARRAQLARRILTGLVTGWAWAAVLAVVTVATDDGVPRVLAAGFSAVVGMLLVLRQRVHVDVRRRIALNAAGLASLATTLAAAVTAAPGYAAWLCCGVAVAGAAVLSWWLRGIPVNPLVRSSVQLLEYLSLAAVVPLAAWVAGVYGMVRDLSLA